MMVEFGKRAGERDVVLMKRSPITRNVIAKAFEMAVRDFANRHGIVNDHLAMKRFLEEEPEVANGLYTAYAVAPRDESAVTKANDSEDAIETVQRLVAANVQKNATLTPSEAIAKVQASVPIGPHIA
jgi:hypothetical protein